MNDHEINDMRSEKEFKGVTFSNFKRTDVKKELLNSLSTGKIEPALHWSIEFICCGCYIELWDILLNFMGKHYRFIFHIFIYFLSTIMMYPFLTNV